MYRVIEEAGLKVLEHSAILMPVLLSLLKDADPVVARQSIVSGSKFFYAVLEDIAMQVSPSHLAPTFGKVRLEDQRRARFILFISKMYQWKL